MISIVIPTHNRHLYLNNALRSIIRQSQLPEEVIVIDDGSTPPICQSIFDDFPQNVRCILLRNSTPQGANYSRNYGVNAATEKFIAFLDDDDIFLPEKVEILKSQISLNQHIDIFYHVAKINMVNERLSYITKPKYFKQNLFYKKLLTHNFIGGTPMVIIRRESLIKIGGFNNSLPALQDYDLWLRLARDNYNFLFINYILTSCNYHTKQASISKSIDYFEKAVNLIRNEFEFEYSQLSKSEWDNYTSWIYLSKVHKSLLNLNYYLSVKVQFFHFLKVPSIINLIRFIVLLGGPKFVFFVKSKVN